MARKAPKKKTSPKTKSRKRNSKRSFNLPSVMRWGLIVMLWGGLVLGGIVLWYASELPAIVENTKFERRHAITVKAADGSVAARYGDFMGNTLGVDDLPPHLVHAVMAIEDRRFYKHFGLDPIGLARAVVVNLTRGGVVQGGSTITQQLAKNLFLTQERTYKRKAQEAMLALWLEWELSKDEIMSAYLNRVYLGSGAFGVEAASQIYFNKSARDVNLREAATLAGLLKAPSRYSPLANPNAASSRADVVLAAMLDAGYITRAEMNDAEISVPVPTRKPGGGDTERYFTDWIIREMNALIGQPDRDLTIETTMWPETQEAAGASVNRLLDSEGNEKNAHQAAVVVIDTSGAVRAMVGGRDYDRSQFNRATQSLRQPGSTFKPFVYLAALEAGWRPEDLINDVPVTFGKYSPENFKGEYYGEVPLHFALSRSLNAAAVQLADYVGVDSVIRTAHNLGIRRKLGHDMSLALGSNGVPVLEMATAYASIASGGIGVDPYGIERIVDEDGNILYQRREKPVQLYVASERAIRDLTRMMQETIDEGTGRRARIPHLAAGKTGTSQDHRDAWFIGFSGPVTTAVWVGNDDNSAMKQVTGGGIPAAIWHDVMVGMMQVADSYGLHYMPTVQGYAAQGWSNVFTPIEGDPNLAYDDPRAAWNNQGRQKSAQARENSRSFGDVLNSIFGSGRSSSTGHYQE